MLSNTATNERSSFLISNLVARLVEEELQQLDLGCHVRSINCSVVRRIRRRQGRFTEYSV